jgi:stage V sporulation protein R
MGIPYNTNLPPDLRALKEEIEGHARSYGLDFYETIFEVLDGEDLNEVAAYGGFPTRYPHWSFGMSFEELKKGYDYGLSKIYEMVINNDPCYAYLMRCNHTVDQKLVMAHVYGHCLAPETQVETEVGVRPITEVRVGDKVLAHTGVFRRVKVCARRWFTGKIYRISLDGSSEAVRITGEHPVCLLRDDMPPQRSTGPFTRWSPSWVKAREIQVGDRAVSGVVLAMAAVAGEGELYADEKRQLDGDKYRRVRAVETEDYDGFVYNFSVEEDESYTLAAGMVVHNCDFFKNNAYFAHTNRKMMDEMANHGTRLRRYVEKHGEDEVEAFIDRCMSIDDLIDIHSTAIRRRDEVSRYDFSTPEEDENIKLTRFKSKDYMDDYINPRAKLKAEEEEKKKLKEQTAKNFPEQPEKDVLLFLIEHAPLKPWQRDVLSIVRDEAYYFAPQGQTKVINEGWACVHPNSFVFTDLGLIKASELVEGRLPVQVADGDTSRRVYDWARFPDRETVWVRTRRGLELEGSTTHQLLLADGSWRRLDEVQIGTRVRLAGGAGLWPKERVSLAWQPETRMTIADVARMAGTSIYTVRRHRQGHRTKVGAKLEELLTRYQADRLGKTLMLNKRKSIRVPALVDESFAAFLGYLIGDGHISERKRTLGITTADDEQVDRFVELSEGLFGISPVRKWTGTKWRVRFTSAHVQDFLKHLGLKTGVCARQKMVPDAILRSPKTVVASFLRAYYDCDGYAGKQGVILATSSVEMSKTVQLLLLNFGILSTRRPHEDGCWHVQSLGKAAETFYREIGFGLTRKQEALRRYVEGHRWYKRQDWDDEVVAVERRRADVYDVSVEGTHRYAAQGFINHNSFWHSTIMTERALEPWECVDYADHHSGTMATSRGRVNPYKLGIELLRDIEHRWNTGKFGKEYDECDDLEKKRKWDKKLGLGRKKIFEVRRVHNDITFIETFLTPEFCREHKMFSFAYHDQAGQYLIESREFEKIKQRLLFSLTNFGKPWIYVVDGNYRNRGELLLRHLHNGVDLRLDQAADTLANIQFIWSRPVHLQTVVEEKPTMLSYDGADHSIRTQGEADDPRRNAPTKTR